MRQIAMRIFITGGTGYLGRALIRQARKRRWQIGASAYTQIPPGDDDITWTRFDIRDQHAITDAFKVFRPELVIHTAYRQREPDLMAVTGIGAGNVARASRTIGARLIHLSSDVLFDGEHSGTYSELDPPGPITPYGEAKAIAEKLVTAADPQAVIVRTSLIYGFKPIDPHTRFILEIADGQRDDRLFTDEYRCPIFVDDLAAALLELGTGNFSGLINIAGTEPLSRYEFGILLARFWGRDPKSLRSGLSSESTLRRPRNCVLATDLASRILRTPLRGVREVLQAQEEAQHE